MIDIRKLAAIDMAIHGPRFILAEFALGIVLPFALGLIAIRDGLFDLHQSVWVAILGFWLVSVALNYIPLFLYAISIARAGTIEAEGQPELTQVKRYGIQQFILLIPCLVVVLALVQERRR